MQGAHKYPEPDPEENFVYVREWEDAKLMQEFHFLSRLYHVVCAEVAFRADKPQYRDGTDVIESTDIKTREIPDQIADVLQDLNYTWPEDYYELKQ